MTTNAKVGKQKEYSFVMSKIKHELKAIIFLDLWKAFAECNKEIFQIMHNERQMMMHILEAFKTNIHTLNIF